jgi:hypothetical protein
MQEDAGGCRRMHEDNQNTLAFKEGFMPSEDNEILPISP